MARKRAQIPLNVFINGRLVGVLRRASSGAIDFQYSPDWLDWPGTFPISLSLPLREDRYIGAPVFNVFDNLLPDNDPIRNRVAERVGANGTDVFSLLTAIGRDCIGAMQFLPEGADPGAVGAVVGHAITDEEIADRIRNLADAPLGMREDEDFRISIAGAQEKTALLRRDGQWFEPVGTTATTHIFKPQIGLLPNGIDLSDSVENEYFCLKLLEAFDIAVAKAEIADFDGRKTLIVERFDRRWIDGGRLIRLPQEDFCQALSIPPTRKYQSDGGPGMVPIIDLLKGSDEPDRDIPTFVRANILFWLLGATDGHAKNFSVFLGSGGRYHMTPLYDVLTAQPSLDAGQISLKKFKLAMSVGKSRHYAVHEIMPRHFLETASLAGVGIPTIRGIFESLAESAVQRAETVIEALPDDFPVPLTVSVQRAVAHRTALIADALAGGLTA